MKTRERDGRWESTDRDVSSRRSQVIWKQGEALRAGTARGPEFGRIGAMRKVGALGEVALPMNNQRFMGGNPGAELAHQDEEPSGGQVAADRDVSSRRSKVTWKQDKVLRAGTARGPKFGRIATFLSAMVAILLLGGTRESMASGLPVPSFVYYGEITDAFGWPFLGSDNAQVVALRMDGRECGRAPIHEALGPTINYRVEVAMTEPRGAAYASYAVREGERITMVLEAGGTRFPVTRPVSVQAVGRPGSLLRQDLALGKDLDGDGLPDEWEEWLIQGSGGLLTTQLDVRPEDDFDGDGVTNREEYLAGTDPAWDEDLPLLEAVHVGPAQGQVAVAVLTVPGRTYRILGASILSAGGPDAGWSPQKVGLSATADPQDDYWRGDGQLTWVYLRVGPTGPSFLKLEVR